MVKSLATSIITQPANGRLPALRKEAQQRSDAARAAQQGHAYDSAQDRPLTSAACCGRMKVRRCGRWATTRHVQITQSPGFVVLRPK